MKIQKKIQKKWGGRVGGSGLGGSGWIKRRIEVFEKLQKNRGGGVSWGVGLGGRVGGGFRVDVNAMLGVGGDVGYGGCEPRIEGIVQCTKAIVQY